MTVRILGLDHVVLRVRDLEASLRFYRDVLGCPLERELPELGLHQLRAGSALIDLVPVDGPLGRRGGAAPGAEARNVDHFCLRVEAFEGLREHLEAHGVRCAEPQRVYGAEGMGLSYYVPDPDGNVVELKGPAD